MELFDDLIGLESLQMEILDSLSKSEDGLSGDDLYNDSKVAEDRKIVSKALSELRSGGKIVSKSKGDKRSFVITKDGLDWLLGGKKEEKPKLKEKKIKGKSSASLAMVPATGPDDFRCMLSPDGTLIFNIFQAKEGIHKNLELSPSQVSSLWMYLSSIYPRFVKQKD
ncbi:MAG TPA: hypothetical protein VIY47_02615 [Ignavibacteriaceae bacterium]